MLDSARKYFYERRHGLVGLLGGGYVVSQYVNERLEEVKDKVVRERLARDNLRRRFQHTHEDAVYTIMALIPTLSEQILEEMDVEGLTHELQSHSKSRAAIIRGSSSPSPAQSEPPSDRESDAGSVSVSSLGGNGSWVDQGVGSSGTWSDVGGVSGSALGSGSGSALHPHDFLASAGAQLSDSITTASSQMSYAGSAVPSTHSAVPSTYSASSSTSSSTRSKAELWKEVKMLTLTRTLTVLYSTTLISLLTSLQLALLARQRYVASVVAQERLERMQASHARAPPSLTRMVIGHAVSRVLDMEALEVPLGWVERVRGALPALPTFISPLEDDLLDDSDLTHETSPPRTCPLQPTTPISDDTEMRFLTLSWWILHVGWKDVATRVRQGVEGVFEGVSLKTKLGPTELHGLLADVRRRVEYEVRFEGGERRISFLSSLLPPTPETTAHVLAQGGAPPHTNTQPHPPSLLEDPHVSQSHSRESSSPTSLSSPSHSPPRPSHSHIASHASPAAASIPTAAYASSTHTTHTPDSHFTGLLAQTRSYLLSPDFAVVLEASLDRAMEVLIEGLRGRVFVDSAGGMNDGTVVGGGDGTRGGDEDEDGHSQLHRESAREKEEVKVRLAGLLPGLARWSQLALNGLPNELVDNIMGTREVSALEAIVISDYQDRFPGQ
ncbi:hypothetical protein BV22DRAFT_1199197 [Leucogyrophana mollusca]|uniref:Uncharacterized protein n=1 Tax=Leucogyrophana mollusca TaxID=85980 RepID=A0ACB8B4L1_9AGAM|nr:hypothetical protein BV22DRAFT_1199197 [Leucogyrophana mollusca]